MPPSSRKPWMVGEQVVDPCGSLSSENSLLNNTSDTLALRCKRWATIDCFSLVFLCSSSFNQFLEEVIPSLVPATRKDSSSLQSESLNFLPCWSNAIISSPTCFSCTSSENTTASSSATVSNLWRLIDCGGGTMSSTLLRLSFSSSRPRPQPQDLVESHVDFSHLFL